MMTRKDYRLIASSLNTVVAGMTVVAPTLNMREYGENLLMQYHEAVVEQLSLDLLKDNCRFNADRFKYSASNQDNQFLD